jgi:hypothetical protein
MSNNTEIKDSNYYINFLESSISKKYIKCYKYSDFNNIKPIGDGSFGSVVRANLKNYNRFLALKSFNYDRITLKEVVNEVLQHLLK